jgi:hypothetical protein
MNRTDMNKQIKGYKAGRKVRKSPKKKENTGGSEDLKLGMPRTTDVAGSKKFINKQGIHGGGKDRGQRDFMQMLEGMKEVPGSGHMTRDPKTGKEMPVERSSDLTTKRRRQKMGEKLPFFKELNKERYSKKMDPSVAAHQDKLQKMSPSDLAMHRARKLDTSAEEDFKKGGKVKKSKKSSRPRGCGIAKKGVRKAKYI